MISAADSFNTYDIEDYVILPSKPVWDIKEYIKKNNAKKVPVDFNYSSKIIVTGKQFHIRKLIKKHLDKNFKPIDEKIGVIGINDGNGHPYSFSAMFNGFVNDYLQKYCSFDLIKEYLPRDLEMSLQFKIQKSHIFGLKTDINLSRFRKHILFQIYG